MHCGVAGMSGVTICPERVHVPRGDGVKRQNSDSAPGSQSLVAVGLERVTWGARTLDIDGKGSA